LPFQSASYGDNAMGFTRTDTFSWLRLNSFPRQCFLFTALSVDIVFLVSLEGR
jgi:hypothetical protein